MDLFPLTSVCPLSLFCLFEDETEKTMSSLLKKTKLYLTHKQNYIITTYIYIASVCSSVVSSYVSESIKGKVKKISMPLQCIKN